MVNKPKDDVASQKEKQLKGVLKRYAAGNMYNTNKMVIFYKLTPNETSVYKDKWCTAGNRSKERIRVLVCTNSVSSKNTCD